VAAALLGARVALEPAGAGALASLVFLHGDRAVVETVCSLLQLAICGRWVNAEEL
jgi:hypothetical protein